MRRQDIASLALRLLGIYCFLWGLVYAENAAHILLEWNDPATSGVTFMLPTLATTTGMFVASILLLVYARPLGRRLTGPEPQAVLSERWTNRQVQAIALCVVGAYLIAANLPEVLTWGGRTLYVTLRPFSPGGVYSSVVPLMPWYMMLDEIAAAAMGLWLFLGSAGWIGVWHRIRRAGTSSA